TSQGVTNFPQGYALATVFTNGIPSVSRLFQITARSCSTSADCELGEVCVASICVAATPVPTSTPTPTVTPTPTLTRTPTRTRTPGPTRVPASITLSTTGSMSTTRDNHTATLLSSGKVLVAGGYNGGTRATTELYDPAAGTWSASGSLISG